MTERIIDFRRTLQATLDGFAKSDLAAASIKLLDALGYASKKTIELGTDADEFLGNIENFSLELGPINRDKLKVDHWKSCAFLFQLTNDEIPSLAIGQIALNADSKLLRNQIESFVFLAIELDGEIWSRTHLATITRELNRRFPMPAILLFRYNGLFSLAIIDRRQNLRDFNRDVLSSRITIIKDVRLSNPHRAHLDILASLSLSNLGGKRRPSSFRDLYDAWIETLSTEKLNENFYRQLAWWYHWAVKEVRFPKGGGKKEDERNAIGVIRLLTRLIFVWFIKERGLVQDALFDLDALKTLLKQAPDEQPEEGHYYNAILQNLFFATLNTEMGAERRWAKSGSGMKSDYLISLVYRHDELFQNPDTVLAEYFANVPFLNGGLFECLDEALTEHDLERNPELRELAVKEGKGWVLRIDGFSRRQDASAHVPNKLFFGGTKDAGLNKEFDTKGRLYPVKGLIDLLNSYKFTIDENTPLEEEVALDPELLGKVFENLLASYNEDTRTTARKKSGSFYTPREVVDYMVDEALISYFTRYLDSSYTSERDDGRQAKKLASAQVEDVERIQRSEDRLRRLLSYADTGHDFSEAEANTLVIAIENLKVLDPACGSGAFPMGILAKLFIALQKLDPDNRSWREQNLHPLQERFASARKTPDPVQREAEISDAEAALEKHQKDFSNPAYADYTRKLYLIEKCIFGSDIQPIAVQIAKLRFFIALIVSQPIDPNKPNWNITPLPNLETKIVAANTLFGVPRHGAQGSLLDDPDIAEKEAELRDANAAYFIARTRITKQRRKEQVQKLHDELVALLKSNGFVTDNDADRMGRWDPFDQNRHADFFDVEWMFGLPRACDNSEAVFDIVIGNPPYVRQEKIKELKPLLKDVYQYECYTGTADLFVYFYERSIKLLKPHGTLSFITSNKWYRAKYGENLRRFMATQTQLKNVIDFGDEAVFTAIAYPTILIATRREKPVMLSEAVNMVRALNWEQKHPVEQFPHVFQEAAFDVPQSELKKEGWQIEPPGKRRLLDHIRKAGKPLGEYVERRFYYGIKTGLNEAFVIDGETRERLIAEDSKSKEVIKPFLRGRDIKRWQPEPQDLWLIFTRRPFDIKRYPAIRKHLAKYRKQLEPKPDHWDDKKDGPWPGRKAGSYAWYEIQDNIAYWQEFEQPKILVPAIEDGVEYAPDLHGFYGNDKTNIIVTDEWRYVLGVLNSSLSWWITKQTFSGKQGGFFEFKPMYVSQLPIPIASTVQKNLMGSVVDAVLCTRDQRYEQLINGLVFELFFPDELHAANIRLFEACEKAGVDQLAGLKNEALAKAAEELVVRIFANDHPIYAMLFDLQALEVVRIIEGKE